MGHYNSDDDSSSNEEKDGADADFKALMNEIKTTEVPPSTAQAPVPSRNDILLIQNIKEVKFNFINYSLAGAVGPSIWPTILLAHSYK